MKVVQINASLNGSTGKICKAVSGLLTEKGVENYIFYSAKESDFHCGVKYQKNGYTRMQTAFSRLLGNYGFNAKLSTKKLIKQLKKIQPSVIHLHNVHSHNLHLGLFFEYVKQTNVKVFWTFHDCWAFTAYCPHFDRIGCEKWESGCFSCPQKKQYSWFFDKSKRLYEKKKKALTGVNDMTIVTPSKWLAGLVKRSFLKEYPVKVVHNGIDLSVFQPTKSDFKEKYRLQNKKIVLGVAFDWGVGKGLDVFVDLSKRLSTDYQIVLVGTDENVDKQLPKEILSIHRTKDQKELAGIYTAADVFVNPTREETYPTVNMESIACGTPVVTFKTGGSPEIVDETCGFVVKKDDIDGIQVCVERICKDKLFTQEAVLNKALSFDQNGRFAEYVNLYGE